VTGAGQIVVFAGPSLPTAVRPHDRRLSWRPPARAGDCLEIDAARRCVVVLIDGAFGQEPAVRHKELMLLMSRGMPLIGAASMGALRAAELTACGMIGIGRIFQAYASGRLVRDDEVALLHAPAQLDWAPLTEPLVNVRATLLRAVRAGVVPAPAARTLLILASGVFYQERTWPIVLEAAGSAGVASADLRRLETWLPAHRVDLKRADAQAALRYALTAEIPAPEVPPPPATSFLAALAGQLCARPAPG
jgi:hypothetical protein